MATKELLGAKHVAKVLEDFRMVIGQPVIARYDQLTVIGYYTGGCEATSDTRTGNTKLEFAKNNSKGKANGYVNYDTTLPLANELIPLSKAYSLNRNKDSSLEAQIHNLEFNVPVEIVLGNDKRYIGFWNGFDLVHLHLTTVHAHLTNLERSRIYLGLDKLAILFKMTPNPNLELYTLSVEELDSINILVPLL